MKKPLALLMLFAATMLSGCGDTDDVVTIRTPYGDMVAILYDQTPQHKANFLKLVNEKYYDSTLFHRVMQGFMIQGGDPDSKKAQPGQPLGQGGPGYTVPAEFNPNLYHEKGAIAAARLGDQMNPKKESSGSQFYIVQGTQIPEDQMRVDQQKLQQGLQQMYQTGQHKPLFDSLMLLYQMGDMDAYQQKVISLVPRIEQATGTVIRMDVSPEKLEKYTKVGGVPFLDGNYTVFGQVISGLDVLDKIAAVPVGPSPGGSEMSVPQEQLRITVTSKKMSKKQIEKEYSYKYPEIKK